MRYTALTSIVAALTQIHRDQSRTVGEVFYCFNQFEEIKRCWAGALTYINVCMKVVAFLRDKDCRLFCEAEGYAGYGNLYGRKFINLNTVVKLFGEVSVWGCVITNIDTILHEAFHSF